MAIAIDSLSSFFGPFFRPVVRALFVAIFFCLPSLNAADDAPLQDYVIERYGTPPIAPVGPLPEPLKQAVRIAFFGSIAPIGTSTDGNSGYYTVDTSPHDNNVAVTVTADWNHINEFQTTNNAGVTLIQVVL